MRPSPAPFRAACALALLALAAAARPAAAQCTTSWTNASGGAWSDAGNWSNGVPTASSVACIILPGTYTVTAGGFSVDSLRLGGASGAQTLFNTGDMLFVRGGLIRATGVLEWRNRYVTGGTLRNQGLIRLVAGGGDRGVINGGAVLRNEGTVRWEDGIMYLYNQGRWENAGLIDYRATDDRLVPFGAGPNVFVNEATGTVAKTAGGGTFSIEAELTNRGTVNAQNGTIYLRGATTHATGSTLTASAGASVVLEGGSHLFQGTVGGSPAGAVVVASDVQAAPPGAAVNFGGTGLEWQTRYVTSGMLRNTGLVRLTTASAQRGVINGGSVFRNEGTLRWEDGIFYVYNGGRLENAALIDYRATDDGLYPFGAGPNVFANEATGTLTKTAGGGYLIVGTETENRGTISAATGTVYLRGPTTHANGSVLTTTADGASVAMDQGTHTVVGTVTGSPVGPTGGVAFGGSAALTGGAAATLNFAGAGFDWQNGYVSSGTLRNAGLIRLTTASTQRGVSNAGSVFRNTGTVQWEDGIFYVYNGGRLENAGLIDYRATDDGLYPFGAGPNVFANEATGTVAKTAGIGFLILGNNLDFTNQGTIDARAGTIYVRSSTTHATGSALTASAGASVVMDQGIHTVAGTVGGSPAGAVVFNGSAELRGGAGALNLGGTGFEWQNGYVTGGIARNTGLVRLTTGTAQRGAINAGSVFRNEGTVQWEDGIFYVWNQGRLENAGLIDYRATGDQLAPFGSGPNVFVNEAAGTLAKTAGGGTLTVANDLTFTNRGTISAENGTIILNSTTTHTGLVRGTATVQYGGVFTNDGAFGPGLSPGTLTVNNAYTNNALEIELGGPAAGTEYDRLVVNGAATIADTLRVSFLADYKPSVGDSFTILTASSVTGAFSALEVPDGFAFSIAYNPTSVVLTTTAVGTASTLAGAQGWRMLAASVEGQTVDSLLGPFWTQGFPGSDYDGTAPPAAPNVYRYDETVVGGLTDGYVPQGNQSDALGLGTGRMVYVYADDNVNTPPIDGGFPKLVVQSGTEATGAFTFPVTYTPSGTAANDGWNLLGNPYAATMNWDAAGWTKTNVSNAIYVWDPATAQYRTWNGTAGSLGSGLVAPAQAFWVQTTAAAPALAAPSAARTTGGTFLGRTAGRGAADGAGPDDALIGLTLADAAGGPLAAWAHVLFTPEGADGPDARDAYELAPLEGSALALFTADGVGRALDVQTRPPVTSAVEIPVGVAAWQGGAPVGGTYTLTWPDLTNVPGELRLLDVATGEMVDLRETDHYTFALTAEESAARAATVGETAAPALIDGRRARFVLTVNAGVTAGESPVAAGPAETALFAPAPNPSATSAEIRYDVAAAGAVRVAVYDLLGREVARLADAETAAGTYRLRVEAAGMAAGVYVVRMTGPHGFVATQRMTVAR